MTIPILERDAGSSSKPVYDCDPDLKLYNRQFVRSYKGPYGLQWPGKAWTAKDKPISDPLVAAHLAQKYWVAKAASFYPGYSYLDFDARRPPAGAQVGPGRYDRWAASVREILDRVGTALDLLRLSSGQYQLMTSPGYAVDGSMHLGLRLEVEGAPAMYQYAHAVLHRTVGDLCEVYPQKRRKFRLPLGRDQYLLGEDLRPLPHLCWQEAMSFLDKLDPVPVETLPYHPPPRSLPPAARGSASKFRSRRSPRQSGRRSTHTSSRAKQEGGAPAEPETARPHELQPLEPATRLGGVRRARHARQDDQ